VNAVNKAHEISAEYLVSNTRQVSLFRNGANQAIRIPKEFELPGKEALLYRDGDKLVLQAIKPARGTAQALSMALQDMAIWGTLAEDFPDVDQGLGPLDDIRFDAPT
jgi:antitoxin VapB